MWTDHFDIYTGCIGKPRVLNILDRQALRSAGPPKPMVWIEGSSPPPSLSLGLSLGLSLLPVRNGSGWLTGKGGNRQEGQHYFVHLYTDEEVELCFTSFGLRLVMPPRFAGLCAFPKTVAY